jgi:hypothetical protein
MTNARNIKCGCIGGCGCTWRMAREWIRRARASYLTCPSCHGLAREGEPAKTIDPQTKALIGRICERVAEDCARLLNPDRQAERDALRARFMGVRA